MRWDVKPIRSVEWFIQNFYVCSSFSFESHRRKKAAYVCIARKNFIIGSHILFINFSSLLLICVSLSCVHIREKLRVLFWDCMFNASSTMLTVLLFLNSALNCQIEESLILPALMLNALMLLSLMFFHCCYMWFAQFLSGSLLSCYIWLHILSLFFFFLCWMYLLPLIINF